MDLNSKERNELKDSDFGIPEKRKYPLIDADHVRSAISYFNKCEPKYRKTLAKNIKSKAKQFNVEISKDNPINKYLKEYVYYRDLI